MDRPFRREVSITTFDNPIVWTCFGQLSERHRSRRALNAQPVCVGPVFGEYEFTVRSREPVGFFVSAGRLYTDSLLSHHSRS
jgi:hypothetical protein